MPFDTSKFYSKKDSFGLDIGTHSLKVVQLKKKGKKTQLVGYGDAPIADGIILEGIISDPEAIANTISELIKNIGRITAKQVTASLPESKIFTRVMDLPEMGPKQMQEAVSWEAEQYIPVPNADLYIDWQVIKKNPVKPADTKGKKKPKALVNNDVLMVAAPKSIVDSYLQVFKLLNVEPLAIEMSLAAITRAVITPAMDKMTTLVINIGAEASDIGIVKNRTLRLTGSTPTGGDSITSAISSKLKIEQREADELKKKFGISEWGLQEKVLGAVGPILEQMITEIQRIVRFYNERDEDAKVHKIERVYLVGGAANMPGFKEYLAQKLALPVEIGNPWANVEVYPLKPVPKTEVPLYATAIGLAMRGLEQ